MGEILDNYKSHPFIEKFLWKKEEKKILEMNWDYSNKFFNFFNVQQ